MISFATKITSYNIQIFLKPLTDYGYIFYEQPQNDPYCKKLEPMQQKIALVSISAIQGTSSHRIYQELGLQSLKLRRWYKLASSSFK